MSRDGLFDDGLLGRSFHVDTGNSARATSGIRYPRDFVQVVERLADYWSSGGRCRLIANAGGLNPQACPGVSASSRQPCRRSLKIAVVSGDNVLNILSSDADSNDHFRNLDDGRLLCSVRQRLVTANAYMGCQGIVLALQTGADIVITGRGRPFHGLGCLRLSFWLGQR